MRKFRKDHYTESEQVAQWVLSKLNVLVEEGKCCIFGATNHGDFSYFCERIVTPIKTSKESSSKIRSVIFIRMRSHFWFVVKMNLVKPDYFFSEWIVVKIVVGRPEKWGKDWVVTETDEFDWDWSEFYEHTQRGLFPKRRDKNRRIPSEEFIFEI